MEAIALCAPGEHDLVDIFSDWHVGPIMSRCRRCGYGMVLVDLPPAPERTWEPVTPPPDEPFVLRLLVHGAQEYETYESLDEAKWAAEFHADENTAWPQRIERDGVVLMDLT